jgi:methylmalonyl-CoA mutase C-terminal domain/subunit
MKQLKEKGLGDVMVLVGGLIPDEDIRWLKEQGIKEVFGAGADTHQLVELVGSAGRK